jgi:carbon-monoxide dehydrogenase medium subunit
MLPAFEYREPETLEEAIHLLREGGDEARVIGGGTALVVMLRARLIRSRLLVGLGGISGLGDIRVDWRVDGRVDGPGDGSLRIGALATHREIERSREVRRVAPLVAEACGRVGSPTIRNMGTLGGNLAYGEAASDPAPALLALDARVTVTGPAGERTVPLDGFFHDFYETALGPAEILTAVHVPHSPAPARSTFVKYTCLSEEERAVVSVAAVVVPGPDGTWSEVRIGLGGVAPTPIRARGAEAALGGRRPTDGRLREAAAATAADVDPLDDRQGSAEYRRAMTEVWVRRALETLRRE